MASSERYDLLIRGGKVASGKGVVRADVGVRGGRIASVGDLSAADAAEVLDAAGLLVLPGAIDAHVHFREPGAEQKEDIESGSRAAVMGGVTTAFDMPNTDPPTTTAEALADKVARAQGRAWCNMAFQVGATAANVEELPALESLPGCAGVKLFMGSSTGSLLLETDEDLTRALHAGARPAFVHAEDEGRLRDRRALLGDSPHVRLHPTWRDSQCAVVATRRILDLCRATRRPVHILHISSLNELEMLRKAKAEGLPVTCEVTPQHLTLNSELYETLGTRLQANPPIRSEEHRRALLAALADGLFDTVGSDHAPHTLEEKARPYPFSPSGMPGVQTLLPAMLDWAARGVVDLQAVVRMTAENPARIFGLTGKGFVQEGYDADLALVDPETSFEVTRDWLQSRCGWSPFEGRRFRGRVVHVVVGGNLTVRDGALTGRPTGRIAGFEWKPQP